MGDIIKVVDFYSVLPTYQQGNCFAQVKVPPAPAVQVNNNLFTQHAKQAAEQKAHYLPSWGGEVHYITNICAAFKWIVEDQEDGVKEPAT